MSEANEEESVVEEKKGFNWVRAVLIVIVLFLGSSVLVCCGGPFTAGLVMNSGEINLSEIDATWEANVGYSDKKPGKALPVKEALETRCSPMKNGIRVLFNHLWYNAITDLYDGRIYLDAQGKSYDSYMLYVWGNYVFLRDEASQGGYVNRVLSCELTYDDWVDLVRDQ